MPVSRSRRRLLFGALALPGAALPGCVLAPYGTTFRPASDDPRALYKRSWCQGQAGPTTRIELPLDDGVLLTARAGRDFAERGRPDLPLRVTVKVPGAMPARFEGNVLQINAAGKRIDAPQAVRAIGGASVAAGAWVDPAKLRPGGAQARPDDAEAPYGRAFLEFAGPAGFAPEQFELAGPAVAFDDATLAFAPVELRRPASAASLNEYRSAAEQADLERRAAACRHDTPQRACRNIVEFGASRSFSQVTGPLRWQGRWYRHERADGTARLEGTLVLAVAEARRWRLGRPQITLRGPAGAAQVLDVPYFDIRFVDRIELEAPLHAEPVAGRSGTEVQIETRLPGSTADFTLQLPPLQAGGRRLPIAPIRFEKRSLDGGIEPFNC